MGIPNLLCVWCAVGLPPSVFFVLFNDRVTQFLRRHVSRTFYLHNVLPTIYYYIIRIREFCRPFNRMKKIPPTKRRPCNYYFIILYTTWL